MILDLCQKGYILTQNSTIFQYYFFPIKCRFRKSHLDYGIPNTFYRKGA